MEQNQNIQEETLDFEINASTVKLHELRKKQKPFYGICAGILVSIAATSLWILMASKYKLSWMAVAVAVGIAFSIQYSAKAVDFWYGLVGASLSLISAITGNLFTAVFIFAKYKNIPSSEVFSELDISTALSLLKALTQPLDYLMYIGAAYAGFYFSFKHFKPES